MSNTNGHDTTNPGLVNVADQGYDSVPAEVPSIRQIPSSASARNVQVADEAFGQGLPVNVNVG